jgi:hypothetical protein
MHIRSRHDLVVVPGAGHLFAEPGALERVAETTLVWLGRHVAITGLDSARSASGSHSSR